MKKWKQMMEIKQIMIPFSGREGELAALRTAFHLAEAHRAHVEVLHISPDPYQVVFSYAPGYFFPLDYPPHEIISNLAKAYAAIRAQAKSTFLRISAEMNMRISDDNVPGESSTSFHGISNAADRMIGPAGRVADLIVFSRALKETGAVPAQDLYCALFETGRPVLIIPEGTEAPASYDRILIAWNGSVEATRAVAGALPLLQKAKVCVFSGRGPGAPEFPVSSTDLVRYLKLHEIVAQAIESPFATGDLPLTLEQAAVIQNASLIVMGAYSHSRFREVILGGLTDHMLRKATLPVLMAH